MSPSRAESRSVLEPLFWFNLSRRHRADRFDDRVRPFPRDVMADAGQQERSARGDARRASGTTPARRPHRTRRRLPLPAPPRIERRTGCTPSGGRQVCRGGRVSSSHASAPWPGWRRNIACLTRLPPVPVAQRQPPRPTVERCPHGRVDGQRPAARDENETADAPGSPAAAGKQTAPSEGPTRTVSASLTFSRRVSRSEVAARITTLAPGSTPLTASQISSSSAAPQTSSECALTAASACAGRCALTAVHRVAANFVGEAIELRVAGLLKVVERIPAMPSPRSTNHSAPRVTTRRISSAEFQSRSHSMTASPPPAQP